MARSPNPNSRRRKVPNPRTMSTKKLALTSLIVLALIASLVTVAAWSSQSQATTVAVADTPAALTTEADGESEAAPAAELDGGHDDGEAHADASSVDEGETEADADTASATADEAEVGDDLAEHGDTEADTETDADVDTPTPTVDPAEEPDVDSDLDEPDQDEPDQEQPSQDQGAQEETIDDPADQPDEDPLVEDFPEGAELPAVNAPGATTPGTELPDFGNLERPQTQDGPERLPEADPVPPQPVVLEPVESLPEDLPEPQPEPPVSLAAVADGAADDFSGNQFGCSGRCITSAVLSSNIHNADWSFEMITSVATKRAIWVLPNGPLVANGMPVHATNPPFAVNLEYGTEWNVDIDSLTHDTTYRVVVTAADNQGNVELATALVTTAPESVDELTDSGFCNHSCITDAAVIPGATFDVASISIETSTPVDFAIGITDAPPITVNGVPTLSIGPTVSNVVTTGTTYQANISELRATTTYWVVVRATDGQGGVEYATGSFITADQPVVPLPEEEPDTVVMYLPRLHIRQDGDAVGKGEISFRYGFREVEPENDVGGFGHYFATPYQKLDAPVSIGAGGFRIVKVSEGELLPPVNIMATEHDHSNGNGCENEVGTDPLDPAHCTNQSVTSVRLDRMSLGWVRTLPTCDSYGVPGVTPNDRCFVLASPNPGSDYVAFDALLAFRIV